MTQQQSDQPWDKTPAQVTARLVELAAGVGVPKEELEAQLSPERIPELAKEFKAHTKYSRQVGEGGGLGRCKARLIRVFVAAAQNGIHVTPTVMVNGLIRNDVSSSWTLEQWTDCMAEVINAKL